MRTFIAAAATTILVSGAAHAQTTVVDPQIWFGPPGTTGPLGGTAIGGESNLLGTSGDFAFGAQLGKGKALQSPTLILIASTTSATVSLSSGLCGGACTLASTGTYGLTSNSATMTSGTIYSNVGLAAGGSESFGNYQNTDNLNGFGTPSEYFISVFDVPVSMQPKTPYAATESGAGAGSFVAGYSCLVGSVPPGAKCDSQGAIGQTPFTNAGLLGPTGGGGGGGGVPEPMTLALFGAGLVGLGFAKWRR